MTDSATIADGVIEREIHIAARPETVSALIAKPELVN